MTGAVANGHTASYTYNADGLRTSKTVDGVTTTHIWDGANMVTETNSAGITAKYYRGNGLIKQTANGTDSYYQFDGHGDTVQLTTATGKITQDYCYDAFGSQLQEPTANPNPFRYAGEYWDAETGHVYLRARYYDPEIGRFISEDPVRDGMNWYAYAGNNPVMWVDPWGMEYIVVSGGRYDSSRSADLYNHEFIEPTIKKLRELKALGDGEGITWMIANSGWSEEEKAMFYEVAKDIGVGIHWTENEDDFVNYINTKGIRRRDLFYSR